MSEAAVKRDWFTPREVAERFEVQYHQVMRMIYEKRLTAYKSGWMWYIYDHDLPETWPPPRT